MRPVHAQLCLYDLSSSAVLVKMRATSEATLPCPIITATSCDRSKVKSRRSMVTTVGLLWERQGGDQFEFRRKRLLHGKPHEFALQIYHDLR